MKMIWKYIALLYIIVHTSMSMYVEKYNSTIIEYNTTGQNTIILTTSIDAVFQVIWMQGKDVISTNSGTIVSASSLQYYNGKNISESWFQCMRNSTKCPGLDSVYSNTQTVFSFTNKVEINYSISTENNLKAVPFKLMLVAVDIPFCQNYIRTIAEAIIIVSTQYQSYATASCGYLIDATEPNAIPHFELIKCDSLDGNDEKMTLYYGATPSTASQYRLLSCKDKNVEYIGQNRYLYIKYERKNASINSVVKFETKAYYDYWYPSFAWIWFILFILLLCCVIVSCIGIFIFPKKKRERVQQAAARDVRMNFSNLNYNERVEDRFREADIGRPPSYSTSTENPADLPVSNADQLDSNQLGQLKQ